MKYYTLAKQDLPGFFNSILRSHRIYAPVRKENQFVFDEVFSFPEVSLEHIPSILPPKKYFLPQHEDLVRFRMDDPKAIPVAVNDPPFVLFGVHTCDIAALTCLQTVFHNDPEDWFFGCREKSIIIIGYECMHACDERATCLTMDTHVPRGFYDIMITDAGDSYIIHVNSFVGSSLMSASGLFTEDEISDYSLKDKLVVLRKAKEQRFPLHLKAEYNQLQKVFGKGYSSPVWDDVGRRCLSCGNCTMICPTCYCFDIYDDIDLKLQDGTRRRVWDSCQLHDFALVATGENFREKRGQRQRHRYYRKFSYSITKYNKYFCVGCGRCTRTCMAGISLIETVNALTAEAGNG